MSFLLNSFEVKLLQECVTIPETILAIEKEITSTAPPQNLLDFLFLQAENKDSSSLIEAAWSEGQKVLREAIKKQLLQAAANITEYLED